MVLLMGGMAGLLVWLRHSSRPGVTRTEPTGASRPPNSSAGQANYASANSISITFRNPLVEQGIQLVVLASDPTTPEIIEGVECHQLMRRPGTYAYFTIDPSFKLTNHFDLEAEVEYFDASPGRMRLQYDAWSSHRAQGRNYSTPRRVVMRGRGEWKTNRFWMPDVRFENRLHGGADFRVEASGPDFYLRRITLRRDSPVPESPYAHSHAVSITLGTTLDSQGLVLGHAPDSVKYATNVAGQECHVVQPGETGSAYLYLAVDRAFKAAHPGPCSVAVEYYSPDTNRFRIEYDGEDNGQASEYKVTTTVIAVAGVWATNIFDLPTPRFKNSQNDEADFRLNLFNSRMFFRKVTLRPPNEKLNELLRAGAGGHAEHVVELLRQGADVNEQDANGETVLMRAAANGHNGLVKTLLVQPKVNPHLRNKANKTAEQLARENGHAATASEFAR